MVGAVFVSAWKTLQYPSVVVPSAVATLGAHFAFESLEANHGFWMLPPATMAALAVVVGVRFWLGLVVSATALDVLRAGGRWRPTSWVGVTTTAEVALVSAALVVPILACLVFLLVPGVLLALRWSQTMWLILDGEAAGFASADISADLVHGCRLEILSVWVILGLVLAVAGWLVPTLGEVADAVGVWRPVTTTVEWTALVGANTFSLVVLTALYYELRRRV